MTETIDWAAAEDGDFADANDWVGHAEPNKYEIANLPAFAGSPYTVTFDTPPGGEKGRTPVTIAGLDVGVGATLDILDELEVGSDKRGTPVGGQIGNEGTIDFLAGGGLWFAGTFNNVGLVEFSGGGGATQSISGNGPAPEIINTGELIFSNNNYNIVLDIVELENDGTISGSANLAVPIVNNGTIYGGSFFETGLALGPVINNGLIEATGGNSIEAFDGVTGGGIILINGGTLQVGDYTNGIFAADVTFGDNANSTFILADLQGDRPTIYTGTILGFSKKGKSIIELGDMVGSGSAGVTYSGTKKGGVLTVTGDGHSDTIAFAGNYLDATFTATMTASGTFVAAGKGGGDASFPLVSGLIQALAGFGSPSGHAIHADVAGSTRELLLSSPKVAIA